ncbi:hypothetical protein [Streptomyces sp. CC208A]|uniref:hypothetical protein n=1 Tax=Streptomyces sp. CC208A TaxID=3044573 RepID=UPI0024A9054C|nr:hypothetical protein [Streptomyces sp. CC208A]
MNPDTYATLYGTRRPAPRRGGTGIAVMGGVLWALSLQLLGLLGFLELWAKADIGPTEGIPLRRWGLTCIGIAAVPIGLLRTPVVRRLSVPARVLVTGLAVCSIVLGLAIRTF